MKRKILYKCPHCGWEFPAEKTPDGLVPRHEWPAESCEYCPGVGQTPRSVHDKRMLWKDDHNE